MNIKGKTKDTIKTHFDLEKMGLRIDLHLLKDGDKFKMPHASYTLSLPEKCMFLQILERAKSVRWICFQHILLCEHEGDQDISSQES